MMPKLMLKLLLCLTAILAVVYGDFDFSWFKPSQEIGPIGLNLTGFDYDAWWGPSDQKHDVDESIREFKVVFDDEMIQDLKYRLKHRRPITPSPEGAWFEYGMNSQVLEDWLNYWENGYPFKEREDFINIYPHFKTNIQGLDIHFIRIRPEVPENVEVVPLLLINGWPSSFTEFYQVILRLSKWNKDRDFAVEVIAPTIPGYTLSEATVRQGLGTPEVAVLFRRLMHRLGHKKYYMAGGDIGYLITNFLATAYPEDVRGYFTQITLLFSIASLTLINSTFAGRTIEDNLHQFAYLPHQATTPDSLGIGFNDSPTGLLSYVLQILYFGTVLDRKENTGAKIEDHIPRDDIMDNIMLYWMTGSIGTSMRMYAETFNRRVLGMNIDGTPARVPTWVTEPLNELTHLPTWFLKTKYPNLISHKALDFGGHFWAAEYPEYYADEVLRAISGFRKKTHSSWLLDSL